MPRAVVRSSPSHRSNACVHGLTSTLCLCGMACARVCARVYAKCVRGSTTDEELERRLAEYRATRKPKQVALPTLGADVKMADVIVAPSGKKAT